MMEFSSPLAALPSRPAWVGYRDAAAIPQFMYTGPQTFGPNSFNFRDLSMKKSSSDYFTSKTVRGSSPTASLAADLSTNFHIDKSPQLPTPRRSLFSTNLFAPRSGMEHLSTPPIDYEGATTPPIPSSSPGADMMDVSPLPHKAPCFVARVTLPSPSPELTPSDDYMLVGQSAGHTSLDVQESCLPMHAPLPERKKSSLLRPALIRTKGHSTTAIPQKRESPVEELPPFKFGSGLTCSSTPSLTGCLSESPMDNESPFQSSLMPPPPVRRPTMLSHSRSSGSPSMGNIKKPLPRPRKQFRRSHSMFEHPGDIMKENAADTYEPPAALSSVMDVDDQHKQKLPHFIPENEPDSLPRIQQDTLVNVLNGTYNTHYDNVMIVDCRFEYEYDGGHIESAVNFNDKELLAGKLFNEPQSPNTLLVFHCEYSKHRAPLMAKFIRNKDRAVNDFQYPKLTYPEMYILEGGYSKFFEQYRSKCYPQNYVEMEDKNFEQDCEKGLAKVKQQTKARRGPLSRAQTFAFGQHCQMEDSPTGPASRFANQRSFSTLDVSTDSSPFSGFGQTFARRMASY